MPFPRIPLTVFSVVSSLLRSSILRLVISLTIDKSLSLSIPWPDLPRIRARWTWPFSSYPVKYLRTSIAAVICVLEFSLLLRQNIPQPLWQLHKEHSCPDTSTSIDCLTNGSQMSSLEYWWTWDAHCEMIWATYRATCKIEEGILSCQRVSPLAILRCACHLCTIRNFSEIDCFDNGFHDALL